MGGHLAHLHAPHAGGVVERREELPHPAQLAQLAHVPHVDAVVAVDAGQPAVGGVVAQRHRVGETAPRVAGEQLTGGERTEVI